MPLEQGWILTRNKIWPCAESAVLGLQGIVVNCTATIIFLREMKLFAVDYYEVMINLAFSINNYHFIKITISSLGQRELIWACRMSTYSREASLFYPYQSVVMSTGLVYFAERNLKMLKCGRIGLILWKLQAPSNGLLSISLKNIFHRFLEGTWIIIVII